MPEGPVLIPLDVFPFLNFNLPMKPPRLLFFQLGEYLSSYNKHEYICISHSVMNVLLTLVGKVSILGSSLGGWMGFMDWILSPLTGVGSPRCLADTDCSGSCLFMIDNKLRGFFAEELRSDLDKEGFCLLSRGNISIISPSVVVSLIEFEVETLVFPPELCELRNSSGFNSMLSPDFNGILLELSVNCWVGFTVVTL